MSSKIESGFIPLPRVEQEQPDGNLQILLNLPSYLDQDRIGVNVSDIASLSKLGGIRPLSVVGRTHRETSHVIPEVNGINSDGSATVSKKIARVEVPVSEANPGNSTPARTIAKRWVSLDVNLNIDEIGQRISEHEEGTHSVRNWSKELDRGLKVPLRRVGHQNLLHKLEGDDFINGYLVPGLSGTGALMCFTLITHAPDIVSTIALPPFAALGYIGGGIYTSLREVKNTNHRSSITPGYQVDRATVLSIKSRTTTLFKDLK